MTLPRSFYDRPTLDVARDLIGKVLVHSRRGTLTSGVIVEAEAYIGESDPACHAAPGPTKRNAPLYGPPGHAYVYLNYGIHSLVNVVTERPGTPAGVLIRALDPLTGVAVMRRRRSRAVTGRVGRRTSTLSSHDICRGPGNLTMAMGITLEQNCVDLCGDALFIQEAEAEVDPHRVSAGTLAWSPRIGISVGTDRRWRVYLEGHPSVSGRGSPRE